jgi:CRISPR-associated protein Csb1
MSLDLSALDGEPRLLIEVPLKPVQGSRFQPTGFPDLGAATFTGVKYVEADGKVESTEYDALLVESAQSMANRLEETCWDANGDEGKGTFIEELKGLPFVRSILPDGRVVSSVTESHRLNSPYFQATEFQAKLCVAAKYEKGKPWKLQDLAKFLMQHDPNSLVHGVFFSSIHDGRMRLPRALSGFIEAELPQNGRGYAESGFSRREDADPSGEIGTKHLDTVPDELLKELGYSSPSKYRSKLKENVKNIIGPVSEFTATSITAYFNLDLAQIRGYGLPKECADLLTVLSLFKIRRLLESSLRLRSRCEFAIAGTPISSVDNFSLPSSKDLHVDVAEKIAGAKDHLKSKPLEITMKSKSADKKGKK